MSQRHKKNYYKGIALKLASIVAEAKHLHYGYFERGLKPELKNLAAAQDNYLQKLLGFIPKTKVKRILDVGCGTGSVAAELVNRGYEVTCLAPDPYLIQRTREATNDRVATLTMMYENITDELPEQSFDLILMSESCQYIKPPTGWPQHIRFLRPGGYILVADFFRIKTADERNPSRSGQMWDDFLAYAKQHNFTVIKEKDITKFTAPTMDIYQSFINEKAIPSIDLLLELIERAAPWLYRILKPFLKNRLLKLKSRYQKQGGDLFQEYKRYMTVLLQKAPA